MTNRLLCCVPLVVGLCLFTPATAQDFNPYSAPYSGVGGLGLITNQTAITQAAIGRRATESAARRSALKLQTENGAINSSILSFKTSLALRQQNYARFVEKTRMVDPKGAADMARAFAASDLIASMGPALSPYGLRTDNVADAYSVYWVTAWLASKGRQEQGSRAQFQAVRAQAANALLSTDQFRQASDAQKQEFAEALLVQALMIGAAAENAKSDPALKRQVAVAVNKGAKAIGLDLEALMLIEEGFRTSTGAR